VPASAQAAPQVPAVYLPPCYQAGWSLAPARPGLLAARADRPPGASWRCGRPASRCPTPPGRRRRANWISVQHPGVTLAPGASARDTITIKVPAGAIQGEPRRPPCYHLHHRAPVSQRAAVPHRPRGQHRRPARRPGWQRARLAAINLARGITTCTATAASQLSLIMAAQAGLSGLAWTGISLGALVGVLAVVMGRYARQRRRTAA
jgi:hypothetical protein